MSRIFVIDDEEGIRFTFDIFLSGAGHRVRTAGTLAEARKALGEEAPDLVFADILLPEGTGIEILEAVRRQGHRCPVILITGEPNIETAAEAVRQGAFDYLPKPVNKKTLLSVTEKALRYRALMEENLRVNREKEIYRRNLEAIFDSVGDAIVTVDDSRRIIEANRVTETLCRPFSDDAAGRVFPGDDRFCSRACLPVLEQTLSARTPVQDQRVECRHRHRRGQVVSLTCSPLGDIPGTAGGAVLVIRDITELKQLEGELRKKNRFGNIIGKSPKMQTIYRLLRDLSETQTTALITGETGTGKELVARALHYGGARASRPFIAVNCCALAESILESELFGHVRGAYTGAVSDRAGRFSAAGEGTIFLDEIGDVSPAIQLRLLRVLQEKEFERVGEAAPIRTQARIIAATNRDLKRKIRQGQFRPDLYYRLNVVEIALPPLRERREDIPLLVDHFRKRFNKSFGKSIDGVSENVSRIFMDHPWPGNVRELEHTIEHAFVVCPGRTIIRDHLPAEIRSFSGGCAANGPVEKADGREKIFRALEKSGGNKARAARILGISRQTLYRKIKEYGIDTDIPVLL